MLLLVLVAINPTRSSSVQAVQSDQCHPWSFYNDTSQSCQCYNVDPTASGILRVYTSNLIFLKCSEKRVQVMLGFCITNEEKGTFIGYCGSFIFYDRDIAVTDGMYVQLPDNITQLNDYICGPMKRRGRVCSECIDGFAPSVTSIGYECSNCRGTWYGVPLYLLLEFVPITIFYLAILVFQVSVTSAPMTCCVMYSQLVVSVLVRHSKPYKSLEPGSVYSIPHVLLMLHGIWNLDFFRYIVPPFCVSPRLKNIHILFLCYISAVYPLLLIAFTWACIELHSQNYKPLVWLWNKCSCFKRKRDSKSTIVDVFATFFFLSYTKLCLTSMSILEITSILQANSSHVYSVLYDDPSVHYLSKEHIPFAIIGAIVLLVSGLLPALFIAIYPIKMFRSLLLKVIPGGRSRAALNTFVEKFYSCYRDGLDGGRDMRSFASLYLFIRILSFTWFELTYETILFGVSCLVIALVRPYKKTYMNNVDVIILALLTLNSYQLKNFSSAPFKSTYSELNIWSMIATAYLPLLVLCFNIFPCKCLFNLMKQNFSIRKLFCIKDKEMHMKVEGLSDNDGIDPDQVMNPATSRNSEGDALLYEPERVLQPVYLSIN